jgi:hypothetical protein
VVTVTDCQRVQTNWFRFRAEACGGAVRTDGPTTWVDGPDGLNLMFPIEISTAGVLREVGYARDRGLPETVPSARLRHRAAPHCLSSRRGWPVLGMRS